MPINVKNLQLHNGPLLETGPILKIKCTMSTIAPIHIIMITDYLYDGELLLIDQIHDLLSTTNDVLFV